MPHLNSGDPLVLPPSNFTPDTRANLTVDVAKPGVTDGRQAYFHHRLAAIGLAPKQAQAYGLSTDPEGNILQQVRSFNGDLIEYIPNKKLHQWNKIQQRKTAYNLHEDGFYSILHVTRRHPRTSSPKTPPSTSTAIPTSKVFSHSPPRWPSKPTARRKPAASSFSPKATSKAPPSTSLVSKPSPSSASPSTDSTPPSATTSSNVGPTRSTCSTTPMPSK